MASKFDTQERKLSLEEMDSLALSYKYKQEHPNENGKYLIGPMPATVVSVNPVRPVGFNVYAKKLDK